MPVTERKTPTLPLAAPGRGCGWRGGGQAPGDLGCPVPGAAPGCAGRAHRAGSIWHPGARWGSLWLTLDPSPRELRAQVGREVGKQYFEEM